MLGLNTLAVGAASVFALVAADHGHLLPRAHHHDIAERSDHHLQKRFGGRATYYQTGLGACGIYNNPSDKIVALNSAQFGGGYPGPNCFKGITICKGSNCHYAQITDECPTCDYGSLDLSQSLFEQFASTDDGIFQMTWTFNDDKPETTEKPDPPKTTKKPDPPETTEKPDPPKTTKKPEPEPEPTTTSERPTTTSKPKPKTTSTPEPTTSTSTSTSAEPTTTSTSEAKSSVTSTSQNPTSAVETSAALSTTTASVGAGSGASSGASGGSNWADMNQVMLAMGRLATVAQEHN